MVTALIDGRMRPQAVDAERGKRTRGQKDNIVFLLILALASNSRERVDDRGELIARQSKASFDVLLTFGCPPRPGAHVNA